MRLLSDSIEDFIKALMEDEQDQQQAIELRRNELAEHFQCAPSQINYVLATRFTPDHGYVIESRRGGGGYIRIMRLASTSREELLQSLLPAHRHVHQFGGRDENRRSSGKREDRFAG